jgi:hypothetical protein
MHRVRHVGKVDDLERLPGGADQLAGPSDLESDTAPIRPPVSASISRKWWVSRIGTLTLESMPR